MERKLLLFTRDLRVRGNPILAAIENGTQRGSERGFLTDNQAECLAVFVWPAGKSDHVLAFVASALIDLSEALAQQGIPLLVLRDLQTETLARLRGEWRFDRAVAMKPNNFRGWQSVYVLRESWPDVQFEFQTEDRLLNTLTTFSEFHCDQQKPMSFSTFRRRVEARFNLREIVQGQSGLANHSISRDGLSVVHSFNVAAPDLARISMNLDDLSAVAQAGMKPFGLIGGEAHGRERLRSYFWGLADSPLQGLKHYQATRNGMMLKDDSSKLSPYLAWGCLGVSEVACELLRFEDEFGANESTQWFWQELLWREYFRWLSEGIGERLFQIDGLRARDPRVGDLRVDCFGADGSSAPRSGVGGSGVDRSGVDRLGGGDRPIEKLNHQPLGASASSDSRWRNDLELFQRWSVGETGVDFVDANMRELRATGWMSNRGRQNVASFLAKTWRVNWTWGAQFFEDSLIDSDHANNWGNWLYLAGVGTDPRDRVFNIERQAELYDPNGDYRRRWLGPLFKNGGT